MSQSPREGNPRDRRSCLQRIVSGGQTGVDRAALDVARQLGLAHGGWCPHGRRAEDGPIAPDYDLRETESSDYSIRTEQNVVESDGTLILHRGRLRGGTELTNRLAAQHNRPCLKIDVEQREFDWVFTEWIEREQIHVLNVAGPRESSSPGIGALAFSILSKLFGPHVINNCDS